MTDALKDYDDRFLLFRQILKETLDLLCQGETVLDGIDAGLLAKITAETPKRAEHGDITTNAALILAKAIGTPPPDLARMLAQRLEKHTNIASAEAVDGFVNCRMQAEFWQSLVPHILKQKANFGRNNLGNGETVNVEYVSANPTGPLHIGHARGAVVGDVVANLQEFCGAKVTREYYVNDGGTQMQWLARSAYWRYLQAGLQSEHTDELKARIATYQAMPDLYPGAYMMAVGEALWRKYGSEFLFAEENAWLDIFQTHASEAMMDLIREDLAKLGIHHDVFTSEKSLIAANKTAEVINILKQNNCLYCGTLPPPKGKPSEAWEARPQLLFRATDFGDDIDRAIQKSDGGWTYFATDIAYHFDKYQRDFRRMTNIFGADHAGYVKRVQAAVKAFSKGEGDLQILTCQLVRFMQKGEPVRMSKRAGTFVTLDDLIENVGADAVRIYMLTRKSDAPLDFDLYEVIQTNRDNPVFYIQYAHARTYSLERMFAEQFPQVNSHADIDFGLLSSEPELQLIKKLGQWPRTVKSAERTLEPHRLVSYAYELASTFHSLWSQGNVSEDMRFIVPSNLPLTQARIALSMGVRYVLQACANVIGFRPLEEL